MLFAQLLPSGFFFSFVISPSFCFPSPNDHYSRDRALPASPSSSEGRYSPPKAFVSTGLDLICNRATQYDFEASDQEGGPIFKLVQMDNPRATD
ncbi:hypothetical protein B0T25DRAFT_542863 [Lasiosphaeria hispida]|uniref:Uncharacterized protein n=1 Tax=Lasiosphaeria hispida TaxID=260671 RepID=A0AAJ0MDW7_9PEZI|nr:hypothetical protein B0T25DRAFT_542863 [Lasiosphaeria hispida]